MAIVEKVIDGVRYQLLKDQLGGKIVNVVGCIKHQLPLHLIIPDRVYDCPVKNINIRAFLCAADLISIKIPDSVTRIDYEAFRACTKLEQVEFYQASNTPKHLYIGVNAFAFCENLREVKCNDVLMDIGAAGFYKCHNFERIEAKIRSADVRTFMECQKLDNLRFYDDCTTYTNTFRGCKNLKHITFLGKIGIFTVKQNLEKFKRCHIQCTQKFNYLDWMYTGADISFI